MRPTISRAAMLVVLLIAAACGSEPTAPPPGINPEITNLTDAFSFQITNLENVSGTYDYAWENTGTLAKVTHASDAGATGSATLTLRDATGTEVYSGALASSGEPMSSPTGVAGSWTISIVFANYSNTQINFGVTKQ